MIILESILVYGTCDQFALARIGADSRVTGYGEWFLQRETPQGIGCQPVADTVVIGASGRANVRVSVHRLVPGCLVAQTHSEHALRLGHRALRMRGR